MTDTTFEKQPEVEAMVKSLRLEAFLFLSTVDKNKVPLLAYEANVS